jgi:hypothetical protein
MKKQQQPAAPPAVREAVPSTVVTIKTLKDVRENALQRRVDLNQTIAELTELADEVNTTLAVLRAQRGG